MKEEIWKPIKGFSGRYEISNMGRIKSLPKLVGNRYISKEKILIKVIKAGRNFVNLYRKNGSKKQLKIGREVGKYFIPNPNNKPQINHLKNPLDDRAEFLEWVTPQENIDHSIRSGLYKPLITIPRETLEKIKPLRDKGLTHKQIGLQLGLKRKYVTKFLNRKIRIKY